MADEQVQPTEDGAVEEQESKVEALTEEQVNSMLESRLEDNNRKWQSRFDQLLKEKKETESKSKTAEEQIAELKASWESERLGRIRQGVMYDNGIDSSMVDAMQKFLGTDEQGITEGASALKKYIQKQIEAGVKTGVEEEVSRRFEKAPKPQGGPPGGEMSMEEFTALTEEQLQGLGTKKVAELTRQFAAG